MAGPLPLISVPDLASYAIGTRPAGDPDALIILADKLRAKASEAGSACAALGRVPDQILFQGPAGDRFARYANATGNAGERIRAKFEAAAASAIEDAKTLSDAQKAWDKQLADLVAERKEDQRIAEQRERELATKSSGGNR